MNYSKHILMSIWLSQTLTDMERVTQCLIEKKSATEKSMNPKSLNIQAIKYQM